MTACALPDDELTPLEDWRPLDELELVDDDVDGVDEVLVAAPVFAAEDDAPGIVAALTALKTPTDATAAMPAPRVRRSSSLRPASRAWMRCSVCFVLSMATGWEDPLNQTLENAVRFLRGAESGVDTLSGFEFRH